MIPVAVAAPRSRGLKQGDGPDAGEPEGAGLQWPPARVPSADQRPDLDRQVARVPTWAAQEGRAVGRIVTEIGSALSGKRRQLLALLREAAVTTIVVEHRGRLARLGAEEVEAALAAQGRRLVVDPLGRARIPAATLRRVGERAVAVFRVELQRPQGCPTRGPHRSTLRWGAPRRVPMGSPGRPRGESPSRTTLIRPRRSGSMSGCAGWPPWPPPRA